MAPPFLRFQTEGLIMWTIDRNPISDEKQDSIMKIENRFRSDGIGKSRLNVFIPKSMGFSQSK